MKVFLFILVATVLEVSGDTVLRLALHNPSWGARVGLFVVGSVLLTMYGTSLNLAPVDFAAATGMYIATLFVVFQIANFIAFRVAPTSYVLVGGALIVTGGMIVYIWR